MDEPSRHWPRIAALTSIAAIVIGIAAYRRAGDSSAPAPAPVAPARDPALDTAIERLERRLAALERTAAQNVAVPPATPNQTDTRPPDAPSLPPSGSAGSAGSSVAPRETPEQHKKRVASMVETYWRDWADRNHLDAKQTETLTALQMDASGRRLDSQSKMLAKEITQSEARAANLLITEEVRRKAKELLAPEQFTQFEAEHGAELGSSYRSVRDALTKAAAANR